MRRPINIFSFLFVLGFLTSSALAQNAPPMKEWTFLVYLNADNNLYSDGLMNVAQMTKVGSNENLNVVVEFDPRPSGQPTKRLLIQKNADPTVVQTLGETDMGDWKHLADFVSWGVQNFPAKRYALVIWNHGNGWKGISYDDNPSSSMSIPNLAMALRQASSNTAMFRRQRGFAPGPLIDILNFDACLMSGLEVAYEMKDLAKVMIGSQFNEPGAGEDYQAILSHLVTEPQLDVRRLAEHMVYDYVAQYPRQREINYLALDLSKIDAFTQAFRGTAIQHVQASGETQRDLRRFYSNGVEGNDLIGGLTGARKVVPEKSPIAMSLDQVIAAYGFPSENFASMGPSFTDRDAFSLKINRTYPGSVAHRSGPTSAWTRTPLVAKGDGTYEAVLPPRSAAQYVVQRAQTGARFVANQEAVSTFVRGGSDPVIFTNQFPPTSPIIAEAHNAKTAWAKGLSLYFTTGNNLARMGRSQLYPQLRAEYGQLAFSRVGAPEWTKFIGL